MITNNKNCVIEINLIFNEIYEFKYFIKINKQIN
jgi:hypothetical protein